MFCLLDFFKPKPLKYRCFKNYLKKKTILSKPTVLVFAVFNFINHTQDVAVVTKDNYKNCTNSTIDVYTASPANIILTTTGEHYFTSTYERHCFLGQKLAINVTGNSTAPTPSGSIAVPPSSSVAPSSHGPSAGGSSPPPVSSAPNVNGCFFTSLLIVSVAFFY